MKEGDGPKVSIVASIYNGRAYLPEFVDYIDRQTFRDFELIFVVDTRSKDGTLEVVEDVCSGRTDSQLIIQDGPGRLGGSKNLGLAASEGDLIWFLDVDDLPSPHFLDRMVAAADDTSSDIAICNFLFTDDPDWHVERSDDVITMSGETALHAKALNLLPITSWSMLYRRSLIESNGLTFREMMCEDIAFTYNAIRASERVCFIPEPLYGYRMNPTSFCRQEEDERGLLELDNYMLLSDSFPPTDRFMQKRFCIMGMRSIVHMTAPGIREAIKDPRLENKVNMYLKAGGRLEYRIARRFPSLYRRFGGWYNRHFYNRYGKVYTDPKKLRTLRRIVDAERP